MIQIYLKKYRTTWSDYKNSGYDRGHTLSNASMRKTTQAQRSTFLMSNITPQIHKSIKEFGTRLKKRKTSSFEAWKFRSFKFS